jgi:hypothetical protein
MFTDGFARADAEIVGNGWVEKNASAFFLQDGRLLSRTTSSGFPQDIMVRPAAEDRLDVETAIEFIRQPNNPNILALANFPQLHARVQRDQLLTAYSVNSYIFFIEDVASAPGRAMFAINRAPPLWPSLNECYIGALPLPTALADGQRYRLRFRVSGTAPVVLTGFVDRLDAGAWTIIASGSVTHDAQTQRVPGLFCEGGAMPSPITTAGGVGVAKWQNRTDTYDNFYWRDLAPGSTPPSISQLAPQSVNAGSQALTLVVTGGGFTPNSSVRWNGTGRPTTYVSSTELRAAITGSDIAAPGSVPVTVFVPETAGLSNSSSFQVLSLTGVETLNDTFTRTDSAALGNSWIEKNPSAFSLLNGRAQKLATPGGDYRNNLAYRPLSEDVLNTEASVEFRLQGGAIGYPQLMVRAQRTTINSANAFDAYMLLIPDSLNQASISRQDGTGWDTTLAAFALSQPINTSDTYRLRLIATGTNPVRLQAFVERQTGSIWQIIGQAVYDDASALRLASPGSVGFGGYIEGTYSFDNFRRTDFGL